jgi:hypothetical protein
MLAKIKEILFALNTVAISFMDTPFLASLPLFLRHKLCSSYETRASDAAALCAALKVS